MKIPNSRSGFIQFYTFNNKCSFFTFCSHSLLKGTRTKNKRTDSILRNTTHRHNISMLCNIFKKVLIPWITLLNLSIVPTNVQYHCATSIIVQKYWPSRGRFRERFVSGADVSCCVGVADWEWVLTFKAALRSVWKHTDSVAIITALWQQQWTWSGLRMLKWLTCIWYTGLWMEMDGLQWESIDSSFQTDGFHNTKHSEVCIIWKPP